VLGLEKDRAPANIDKLSQTERPADQPVAQKALADARQALKGRAASGRER
jgi:hypothetical protein